MPSLKPSHALLRLLLNSTHSLADINSLQQNTLNCPADKPSLSSKMVQDLARFLKPHNRKRDFCLEARALEAGPLLSQTVSPFIRSSSLLLQHKDKNESPLLSELIMDSNFVADEKGQIQGCNWMDPAIWSKLPQALLDRILAMLSPVEFFRFTLVCKRFYRLMFSDSFLEICRGVRAQRPWFLLFHEGTKNPSEGYLFDPTTRAWFRLPIPFQASSFAASSGGLICFWTTHQNPNSCKKALVLCNPLTKTMALLPRTIKDRFMPSIGLVVSGGSYKIVVAGDDLISPFAVKNLTTEVFEGNAQWKLAGGLPRLCSLDSGKMIYCDGYFYCMNYSPFSVLAYDVKEGKWSKIQAPMKRFLRSPGLVECRGRVVLVGAVQKNKLSVPRSIRMWGLQHSRNGWFELERMPNSLYEEFCRVSLQEEAFTCIGHGDFILIAASNSPAILVYDFYEKVWCWAPRCPFLEPEQCPKGFHGFAFEPRLDASIPLLV